MNFRNYTANACRDLTEFASLINSESSIEDKDAILSFVQQLEESVHFALPDFGRVLDNEFKGLAGMELRLPFSSVSLEYTIPTDEWVDTSSTIHAPKRVVFAREVSLDPGGMEGLSDFVKFQLNACLSKESKHQNGRGILVWGASSIPLPNEKDLRFSPELCMWLLPSHYPTDEELDTDVEPEIIGGNLTSPNPNKRKSGLIVGQHLVSMYGTLDIAHRSGCRSQEEIDAFLKDVSKDIAQEAVVVLEFIEALTCSNVKHEIGQAAPKPSVSAKRKRDGKLPIFETRILTVQVPGKVGGTQNIGGDAGSRNSPRQHLRRGHIRRLESGKRVWVQSAVIGAGKNGSINKSYAIQT